ncbi:hypothetical protein S40288_05424, partial [Stachybotrys chartarum IBT 40288]
MTAIRQGHTSRMVQLDPHDYALIWIAPLEIEAQAALHLLDKRHHGRFPVSRGDDYVFYAGSMAGHNIVIATLPAGQEYGTGSAAAIASQVKRFFPNLWFGLLVGVAAGLPDLSRSPARDIRLGDVLVALPNGESAGLIAYGLGKETESGFQPLHQMGHALAVTEPIVRSAIGSIKMEAPNDTEIFLPHYETIRHKEHATGTFADPGQDRDILYLVRDNGTEEVAERARRPEAKRTRVWYGPIGSGDKLYKNAQKRSELRDRYGLIGLEMEAAGTMNRIPVGVIRGVCDYGDEHKNKEWQPYAAAMAASYAKAVLEQIPPHSLEPKNAHTVGKAIDVVESLHKPCYYIKLTKNRRFTGRTGILGTLEKTLLGKEPSRKTALAGLGGVGKTQIALQFAYRVKQIRPDYSIFWVPLFSEQSATQTFIKIAQELDLQKSHEDEDVREVVCRYLSSDEAGNWLLIIDNADDWKLVFGSAGNPGLEEYLPESRNGIILLTTRFGRVAVDFAGPDVIDVDQMDPEEAMNLLDNSLIRKEPLQNKELAEELLNTLTFLPLAITQAAAYLNFTKAPLQTYLKLLRRAEKGVAGVLDIEFKDNTRYRELPNAVGATWLVSFDQINNSDERSEQLAVQLLSFISCIEPKMIPQTILPQGEPEELEWGIGTLCSYSFLVRQGDSNKFDMHSLVHMATRWWLEIRDQKEKVMNEAICHLAEVFPTTNRANRDLWRDYLPHTIRLLQQLEQKTEDAYHLINGVGNCLYADRRFREASGYLQEVYRWKQGHLSEENYSRLESEHALASAYLSDRRIKDAIEILEHVVAVRKETLDEKDHSRLASEHTLASAYLDDRRIKDAIEILEHVVAVRKEILDEKDQSRLASEHALASAYLNDRRIKDAIEILEHVVAVEKEILDEKDHSRLASEHALASAYLDDRRIKDAIKILEHVVAVRKEILDEKDHSRLASEHMLASAYLDDRRIKDAIKILEHVVAVRKETLEEKDQSRLASEHVLASAYLSDRRVKDAIEILEHVVAVEKEILDK